jgi:lipopolysaccharide transport system permease protein
MNLFLTPQQIRNAKNRDEAPAPLPDSGAGGTVVHIRPRSAWVPLNLGELWRYRELLYFLGWRDIKVRYRQTLLGVAWAVIQPLLTMVIFTFFFGRLARVPSDGIPYALFAYAGLLPWMFFANAVGTASNSLINSAHLITKVYFPRVLIPASALAAPALDFAIAFVILAGMVGWYAVQGTAPLPGWGLLLLPIVLANLILAALGVGIGLSALNAHYRDIRHVVPFLIQVWMFATPVIYPASLVPERYRWVLALNPMTGILEAFRSALFQLPFDWASLATSGMVSLGILVLSAYGFRRMERTFADVI